MKYTEVLHKLAYGGTEEDPEGNVHDYDRSYLDLYDRDYVREFGMPDEQGLADLRKVLEDFKHNINIGYYTDRKWKGKNVKADVYLSKYPYSINERTGDIDEISLDDWMKRYGSAATPKELLSASYYPYIFMR